MADRTGIEWTDATWNPLRGCSRVSEGCRHCYAEGVAARFSGPGQPYEDLAQRVRRPDGTSEARWTGKVAFAGERVLTQPLRWKRPRRIFVNSMSDLFHESVPVELIDEIFAVIALCPQHTFQVLTKRPERMRDYLTDPAAGRRIYELVCDMAVERRLNVTLIAHPAHEKFAPPGQRVFLGVWPVRNVWLGVSVEDQVTADTRIPYLLSTPAAVRFVSAEPLLGPVDLSAVNGETPYYRCAVDVLRGRRVITSDNPSDIVTDGPRLDWVIAGGESGPQARPMHPDWARSLRDQCAAAGVAFFWKQWGEWAPAVTGLNEWTVSVLPDGRVREWEPGFPQSRLTHPDMRMMAKYGKKATGRLLDGVEHNGFPEVRHG